MISAEDAFRIIDQNSPTPKVEEVSFQECLGRVLAEDIVADRDFPPYHRAAMDGVAFLHADFEKGIRKFRVVGQQIAGISKLELEGEGTCVEIMTGAILPIGADTIIRFEDTSISDGIATVNIDEIHQWANIHLQGKDAEEGNVVIPAGKKINIGDIGIITSVGKTTVKVKALPRVALISTGNELVEPHEKPEPFQIRKSNVYTISALLQREGIVHKMFHFNDDFDAIKAGLEKIAEEYDLIMMSGGVSMGKKDYIPDALAAIGVEKLFHRVLQRPGKPLWFGKNDKVTVFGFPGNPVSTLVCYTAYFRRWLGNTLNSHRDKVYAALAEDVEFKPDLTYYMPVFLYHEASNLLAKPYKGHGSGDLVNLTHTEAFLCLPRGKEHFAKGEVYEVYFPL